MCTAPAQRFVFTVIVALLTACGGDLTLPDNGSPAALKVVSGNRQEGTVGSQLDKPLVVRLTDASSRPVAGVPIAFSFRSDVPEAEVDPTQAVTDTSGQAIAEVRLGTNTGAHLVDARVAQASAAGLSATFDLTALAREPRGRGGRGGGDGDDDDDDD